MAISPIDGRYYSQLDELSEFYSEYALIHARTKVEVEYYASLMFQLNIPELSEVSSAVAANMKIILKEFSIKDAERIKEIEKETKHDVKAVEYFLKKKLQKMLADRFDNLEHALEFIHFGLTSQDVNNTAIPLMIKNATENVFLPYLNKLIQSLNNAAKEYRQVPMLCRTHGQAATPSTMGKELMVFVDRLQSIYNQIDSQNYYGKFGGATGNFNAHYIAFPDIAWDNFATNFLFRKFGLKRLNFTTQIDHYDYLAQFFDKIKRLNAVLIDFSRDMWQYISMDYFKLKFNENEVGSSTMPHKVNPIDFENAEGNLGMAVAIFEFLSKKLPISRLQRDLTDSTVLRNVGIPVAHTLLAVKSLLKGVDKVEINEAKLLEDLHSNWEVVGEAIQTILRREGVSGAYEKLKNFLRKNRPIDAVKMNEFILTLDISEDVRAELLSITPESYLGNSAKF